MSDETRPPELQFEHAETERSMPGTTTGAPAGAPHCAACQREVAGSYWEHRGRMLCDECRAALVDSWQKGSGAGRFARATLLGLLAAGAGTLVYWAIAELTGYEFSLISLLIGFAVGIAVKFGSRGRGGWRYQALAIFLTYTSIVSTYLPAIWQAAKAEDAAARAVSAAPEPSISPDLLVREALPADAPGIATVTETSPVSSSVAPESAAPEAEPSATGSAPSAAVSRVRGATGSETPEPGFAGCLLGIVTLVGFLYAAPFLAGFENFLGWIILAIGLYQAWKINQPEDREVRGPFAVRGSSLPIPEPPPPPATPA